MSEIKKGTEAKQAVDGFAKEGKVKAYICGTAKMLEEKVKNIDPATAQIAIGGAAVVTAIAATELLAVSAGFFIISNACFGIAKNKPVLLEKLVEASKKASNLINKAMKKGGR